MRKLMLLIAFSSGCVHEIDVMMRNPIVTNAVDPNRVVRPHGFLEQERGLPQGSTSDSASMVSASPEKLCFDVALHELEPIDLARVEAKLVVPKIDPQSEATVQPQQPTQQTYEGLVPERRQTGVRVVCVSHDSNGVCQGWESQPVYQTVMVRGDVTVYGASGWVCFPNRLLNSATPQISLELKTPTAGVGMFGIPTRKSSVFTWGFAVASRQ
jgi:hypothetical protein